MAARIVYENGLWFAEIDGQIVGLPAVDPFKADGLDRVWHYGVRIAQDEYDWRIALGLWARTHAPDHPAADPTRPIDVNRMTPLPPPFLTVLLASVRGGAS